MGYRYSRRCILKSHVCKTHLESLLQYTCRFSRSGNGVWGSLNKLPGNTYATGPKVIFRKQREKHLQIGWVSILPRRFKNWFQASLFHRSNSVGLGFAQEFTFLNSSLGHLYGQPSYVPTETNHLFTWDLILWIHQW